MSSVRESVHPELEAVSKLKLVNHFLNAILSGSSIAFNSSLIDVPLPPSRV
jgi:hypothetical protein